MWPLILPKPTVGSCRTFFPAWVSTLLQSMLGSRFPSPPWFCGGSGLAHSSVAGAHCACLGSRQGGLSSVMCPSRRDSQQFCSLDHVVDRYQILLFQVWGARLLFSSHQNPLKLAFFSFFPFQFSRTPISVMTWIAGVQAPAYGSGFKSRLL